MSKTACRVVQARERTNKQGSHEMARLTPQEKEFLDVFLHEATTTPFFSGPYLLGVPPGGWGDRARLGPRCRRRAAAPLAEPRHGSAPRPGNQTRLGAEAPARPCRPLLTLTLIDQAAVPAAAIAPRQRHGPDAVRWVRERPWSAPRRQPELRRRVRHDLQTPTDAVVILQVSRMEPVGPLESSHRDSL
jgi:hypothetical protein